MSYLPMRVKRKERERENTKKGRERETPDIRYMKRMSLDISSRMSDLLLPRVLAAWSELPGLLGD